MACAGLLAAGLAGIEQKLELEPAIAGDIYHARRVREIPHTLGEAAALMSKSKMLRAAFGEDVVDHYVHAAEWEVSEHNRVVTDWEVKRGFERL
jgi:glutamine synthetase